MILSMNKLRFSVVALLVVGSLTLLLFQNCAPHVSTGSAGSSSLSSLAGGEYHDWSQDKVKASMALYENLCSDGLADSAGYAPVAAGANMNAFGNVLGRITQIDSIIGAANMILYADSAGAQIDSISAFRGKIRLCGIVNVGGVSGFNGDLLVEGTVGPVDGFEGNLIIIGGDFPISVTNTKGIILVKDAAGNFVGRTY